LPNCFLSLRYLVAVSKLKAAAPREHEAILTLPPSSPARAILKPCPYFPSKFCFGTLVSSNVTVLVG